MAMLTTSIRFQHLTLFWFNSYMVLLAFMSLPLTSALQNITVLSYDPSIDYQPSQGVWNAIGDSKANNGSFRLARTNEGIATVTRTFRSVHFVAPLWSFPIQVQVTVGNISEIIDLQDHSAPTTNAPPTGLDRATRGSEIRWSFHDVDEERTVRISAARSDNTGWVAVVDSLIFEVAELGDPPVTSGTPSSSPTTSSDNSPPAGGIPSIVPASGPHDSSTRKKNQRNVIVGSSIGALVLLLSLAGVVVWITRRQQKGEREMSARVQSGDTLTGEKGQERHSRDLEKGEVEQIDKESLKSDSGASPFTAVTQRTPSHASAEDACKPIRIQTESPKNFLDVYEHPHLTPTSSHHGSISTFGAASVESVDTPMLGLIVDYRTQNGIGTGKPQKQGSDSVATAEENVGSPRNSIFTTESSATPLERSAVMQTVECMRFTSNAQFESARASSIVAIPSPYFSAGTHSGNTSNVVTPSTDFGGVQWNEVLGRFPSPPVYAEGNEGKGAGVLNTRRESCRSTSFPYPISRIGLPPIPGSAASTQLSFTLASQAVNQNDLNSSQLPTTAPIFTSVRPLPPLPPSKLTSQISLPCPSIKDVSEDEQETPSTDGFELIIPPRTASSLAGFSGIPTPPHSGTGDTFLELSKHQKLQVTP